ncbi:unnamed protein product [Rotaria sordida]|uniref:lytic cellulose monooxygenase (C4-dehydrogenating) n=1 Tax=Rotaria sordida TaxID=392033 RepID=A0A815EVD4_9BILA|nr:unnamed protein product [Rotaria sordida]
MFFSRVVLILCVVAWFSGVCAHYCWPSVDQTLPWDVVRRTDNYETRNPIQNVNDPNFRCYNGAGGAAPNTYSIEAGNKITFQTDNVLYHIGVVNVYMAKAPDKAIDFDGSGNVWFKIFEITAHADPTGNNYPTFPANMLHSVTFTIPKNVPTGHGSPGPLVSIPGVYTGYEPGIIFDPYSYPAPTSYTQPGPNGFYPIQ